MIKFKKYKGLKYYAAFLLLVFAIQVAADLSGYSIFRSTKAYQEKTAGPNFQHK